MYISTPKNLLVQRLMYEFSGIETVCVGAIVQREDQCNQELGADHPQEVCLPLSLWKLYMDMCSIFGM